MHKQQLGTAIIVINSKNQILLGKRKNVVRAGFYGLPGGKLENKETLLSCAIRELKEETNLDSQKMDYLCVVKEWLPELGYDFAHFIFVCSQWQNQPALLEPDKCEAWQWFDLDKLPDNILPGHLKGIEALKNKEEGKLYER